MTSSRKIKVAARELEQELDRVSAALDDLASVSAAVGRELRSGSGQPNPTQLATLYEVQRELACALDGVFVRLQTRGLQGTADQHALYSEAVSTFTAILLGHRLAELQRSGFDKPFTQLLAEVQRTYVRRV